jgi:TBC1 domain family member 20
MAHDSLDWDALRLQSLGQRGFSSARAYIWHESFLLSLFLFFNFILSRPKLLHVDVNHDPFLANQKELDPHQDERQIRLDTDRSFVLYPVGDSLPYTHIASFFAHTQLVDNGTEDDRLARQAELNNLIVQLFRRHPGLNYFQVGSTPYRSAPP